MRREFFFTVLLIIGVLSGLADIAFVIYLGVMLNSILQGLSFFPTVFPTLCVALIAINAVTIAYSLLYVFVLRK